MFQHRKSFATHSLEVDVLGLSRGGGARSGVVWSLLLVLTVVGAAHAVTTNTGSFNKYSGTEGWSTYGELTYSANTAWAW